MDEDFVPRVYYQLGKKYVELALRYLSTDRDNREMKDRIAREVLARLESKGIAIGPAAPPAPPRTTPAVRRAEVAR